MTVEVFDLAKSYGSMEAVRPTSFRIEKGAFATLLGPSGSGKTTILKMIAGFETPTSGTVLISGESVADVPAFKRNIGFVFQQYALFPHMSVRDNLSYPLRARKYPRDAIRAAVDETLKLMRMEPYADRKPSQLSGGQQQRVALGRAIIFRPRVLLMDEPMAALDRQLREEMQIEIRNLQRSVGITTIAVTHDQGEALTMSDVVLVMKDGRLQQEGSPLDLYHEPGTTFVATFIGHSNLIEGRIARVDGRHVFSSEALPDIALSATSGRTDGPARCLVRPEAIGVGAPPAGQASIVVEAKVQDSIFAGDSTQIVATVGGRLRLVAKVRSSKASMLPGVGETTQLYWNVAETSFIDN